MRTQPARGEVWVRRSDGENTVIEQVDGPESNSLRYVHHRAARLTAR